MTFLIISHAVHYQKNNQCFAYAPYVREMNLWLKYIDEVIIVAPLDHQNFDENININYKHNNIKILPVPKFSLLGLKETLLTIIKLPVLFYTVFRAVRISDHIHLRCPGNMGLIGSIVQIFFPSKPKTAKYAGNWDPKSNQPWTYRLQKWILNNTFLSRNIKVLVYGEWPNSSKNILPFFTATYKKSDIEKLFIRNYTKTLHFCFVGSLSPGKQPDKAIELVSALRQQGRDVILHIYGDGEMKNLLQDQINSMEAHDWIFIYGNQPQIQIKKALKYSHFLILLSLSEGWPKVVAEAMFWGCIPITSKVSCLPWMLDSGKRGILVDLENENLKNTDFLNLESKELETVSANAAKWSRTFTLDKFESQISQLL
jgi:glycosyltransferase involved in cell wall biosynthesis